ncbi:NAD(P)-dependent alcohol dehydrogenase [Nocardia vaccinii]|uniref:NAD(P)-dependent alcohol dehydrogenase n=1 Tax=Nocardia vaccinii TaxID=1822 RepID=UPI001FDFDE36|nr:NAD(P)-dependent alcohol dehydrogenase [Nocardia vaccinii]
MGSSGATNASSATPSTISSTDRWGKGTGSGRCDLEGVGGAQFEFGHELVEGDAAVAGRDAKRGQGPDRQGVLLAGGFLVEPVQDRGDAALYTEPIDLQRTTWNDGRSALPRPSFAAWKYPATHDLNRPSLRRHCSPTKEISMDPCLQPARATKAAVLRSPEGRFELEEVALPELGIDEVLVRIAGAGFCHTDLLPRTRGRFGQPPVILGHESSGVVQKVGPQVTDLRAGDHVVASYRSCGSCVRCRNGRLPYCERFWELNFSGAPRGEAVAHDTAGDSVASRWFGQSSFATHAVIRAESLVRVDNNLPLELLAPLGCSVLTGAASILEALAVAPGMSVAIFGTGAVGLVAVMAARIAGATTICAVDANRHRLTRAEQYGANLTVDSRAGNLDTLMRRATPADGFDVCLDTTGAADIISCAVDALSVVGVCGLLGSPRGDLRLGATALASGRTIRGLLFGDAVPRRDLPQLIELWKAGQLPFDELVQKYPLAAINEAEQDFRSGQVIKPVLLPDHTANP